MKLLALFAIISLWSLQQKPDTWKVTEIRPHPSRYHNSVAIQKKDSTMWVQFDFPDSSRHFPTKGDKVELVNNRKGLKDGERVYDIINIFKGTK